MKLAADEMAQVAALIARGDVSVIAAAMESRANIQKTARYGDLIARRRMRLRKAGG